MLFVLLQKRVRPKILIVALLGVAILLVSMEEMLKYREYGFSDQALNYELSDQVGDTEHRYTRG